ncbi:FIG01005481: hypothetical protein [hydrothermal vent metagenome]|uniref:VWFA domain-containing protein n=1 Tax=hydrothermal vent metagenome TaxID=652676 RepID=A0A3B0RIM8_9ZZZZ
MKTHTRFATKFALTLLAGSALLGAVPAAAHNNYQNVEVAFVLDTTGSMSGLIEGAKQKIWSIANEIIDVNDQGQTKIRFALIGYRDRQDDYVTKSFDMTDDLHGIYGNLLKLQAQGGGDRPESVNQALSEAVNDLSWSRNNDTLRLVFLVGDAPPHMDYNQEAQYPATIRRATRKNIIINTVQAGADHETRRIWKEMAKLGQGDYAAIAQNGGMQIIHTPYDQDIEVLQRRINKTSLGYGSISLQSAFRKKRQQALAAPAPVASDMAEFRLKSGKRNQVITGVSELVEDYEDGKVDLNTMDEAALPKTLQGLSKEERETKLKSLVTERSNLNKKLEKLVKQRETYMDAERKKLELANKDDGFDSQVRKSIARQMKMK